MIVHVSMAIYKPEAGGRDKDANIQLGRQITETLQKLPSVRRIEMGVCQEPGEGGFDTVSYVECDDLQALKEAISDPAHDRLTSFLNEVTEIRNSATYEVNR